MIWKDLDKLFVVSSHLAALKSQRNMVKVDFKYNLKYVQTVHNQMQDVTLLVAFLKSRQSFWSLF